MGPGMSWWPCQRLGWPCLTGGRSMQWAARVTGRLVWEVPVEPREMAGASRAVGGWALDLGVAAPGRWAANRQD